LLLVYYELTLEGIFRKSEYPEIPANLRLVHLGLPMRDTPMGNAPLVARRVGVPNCYAIIFTVPGC